MVAQSRARPCPRHLHDWPRRSRPAVVAMVRSERENDLPAASRGLSDPACHPDRSHPRNGSRHRVAPDPHHRHRQLSDRLVDRVSPGGPAGAMRNLESGSISQSVTMRSDATRDRLHVATRKEILPRCNGNAHIRRQLVFDRSTDIHVHCCFPECEASSHERSRKPISSRKRDGFLGRPL